MRWCIPLVTAAVIATAASAFALPLQRRSSPRQTRVVATLATLPRGQFRDPAAAAAVAPRCFSPATRTVRVRSWPLPSLPLPEHLPRDPQLTRLYLVTYNLLRANGVDQPGRHDMFAYVARSTRHSLWHVAYCATSP